jgi:hypothetical protein
MLQRKTPWLVLAITCAVAQIMASSATSAAPATDPAKSAKDQRLTTGSKSTQQRSVCASGQSETGTLTPSAYYRFVPAVNIYFAQGRQNGCVSGPADADFQLWLYEWDAADRRWTIVARSENPGSEESISYDAQGTYYAWLVYTADGYGDFQFTLDDTPPAPAVPVESFSCLEQSSSIDTSWADQSRIGRLRLGDFGVGTALDLRGTEISVHYPSLDAISANGNPQVDSRWGLIQFDSSTDLCVAGGEVVSPNPLNITWAENYDTQGTGRGYRSGTTRNHTAIDTADSVRPTISGLYFFNLHDGPRFNGSRDWRVEHIWGDYTRDDCIENDEIASGVIFDSLFDGCYTGYSNRATRTQDDKGNTITGIGDTVTFDQVLLRMEMMPGPHKACERTHLYFDSNRDPYNSSACVERDVFGTGHLFKLVDQNDTTGSINPSFRFINSVFVVDQVPDVNGETRADFPSASKITECSNVTIVYLGSGAYPGRLPPQDCYTLLSGTEGRQFWANAVADWHARHPQVAPDRKEPATYGDVRFPRFETDL